jgi:hypothetical protein
MMQDRTSSPNELCTLLEQDIADLRRKLKVDIAALQTPDR